VRLTSASTLRPPSANHLLSPYRKYEEVDQLESEDLLGFAAGGPPFSLRELLNMEALLLHKLNYRLSYVTPALFATPFARAVGLLPAFVVASSASPTTLTTPLAPRRHQWR
jgi:hypothetical protein